MRHEDVTTSAIPRERPEDRLLSSGVRNISHLFLISKLKKIRIFVNKLQGGIITVGGGVSSHHFSI
jgi:hypothetical protein